MHDWHSSAYVQDWIGVYEDIERKASLHRIANLIPFDPDEPIRVLDIGGGWGPVTSAVLEAFPKAQVMLHDFSEPMLSEARNRLAQYADDVSYVQSDLLSPEWTAGIDGPFHAVVSCIAIHNVRFPDRIRAIYHEIFPLVSPGGCFINLDRVASGQLAGRAARHAQLMERRHQIYEETGQWKPLEEVPRPSEFRGRPHAHGETRPEDQQRMATHEPATLVNQLRWLIEAGFDEADCFSRERDGVLLGAFRTG